MRILLHMCCGPCAIMPLKRLLDEGCEVTGYFYNPNIHPLAEYLRRREGAAQVAAKYGIKMLWALNEEDYDSIAWMRMMHGREESRCPYCWEQRLDKTAATAAALGFEAFSSSLLYSRYQNHEVITKLGHARAEAHGTGFLHRDFRVDWQAGIDTSKEWGIYRQQYCGCLFSENERYAKALKKSNRELEQS